MIRRETEGIVLEDLDSHNGTYLNGTRITGKVVLQDQASFILGGMGNSDKECCYTFREIGKGQEDVDTTEDGTRPQSPRRPSPKANQDTEGIAPSRTGPAA